jgi:Wax ester synthase-like Acyl-CoA acyltransferase domain
MLQVKVLRDGVNGIDSRESLEKSKTNDTQLPTTNYTQSVWGDDLYFERHRDPERCLPTIRIVQENGVDTTLERIVESESIQEWHDEDPSKPLWRVTLVQKRAMDDTRFALVLAFHHAIVDGIGALQVARAILEDEDNVPPEKLGVGRSTPLPPMDDVMGTTPNLRHLVLPVLFDRLPRLASFLRRPHWKGYHAHRTAKSDDPGSVRETHLFLSRIIDSEEDMRALSLHCTKHGFSLAALLVGTLSKAVAAIDEKESAPIRFKIQIPVDERRRRCAGRIGTDEVGCYVTGPQLFIDLGVDDSADKVAKTVATRLKNAIQSSPMDVGLTQFIQEDWMAFARKQANEEPNGVHRSLEVSLLSDRAFLQVSSAWKVHNVWFVQGRRGFAPAIMVRTISGSSGLSACMSSFLQVVSKQKLRTVANAWKSELRNILVEKCRE